MSGKEESIHLANQVALDPQWKNDDLAKTWNMILDIRGEVTKALENARVKKLIGHPLDAAVNLYAESEYRDVLNSYNTILKDIFIVSKASLCEDKAGLDYESTEIEGLFIGIDKAPGNKCERCWTYDVSTGRHDKYENACARCCTALEEIEAS